MRRSARLPAAAAGLAVSILLLAAAAVPLAGQAGGYPAVRHGGNYLINYYLPPAPGSTPWAPAWAPDGQSVAVSMAGSIWRVDLASGVAEELTAGPAYHASPDWSPDGRWIIYTADRDGAAIGLAMLDAATGRTHPLTDDDRIYADPVFSPDGARVAYVATSPAGYFNVYVRPIADGRWSGPPAAVTRDTDFGRDRLYFGRWDMHLMPAWLPDGDELLLVSNRGVPLGSGQVLRVPARAGGIDDAVPVLSEQTLYRTRPDVASDGRRFVYASTAGGADQFTNLYVQPTTAGGAPYKLTFFRHDAFHPRWSPDDEWIAFITNAGGLPQLALLETHGGALRTVTITDRRWRRPTGVLAVTTREAATGAPTAARVHLTAADGRFYAPADAYARIGLQGGHLFHQAGRFTIEAPAGRTRLTVVKGFEYWPETVEVEIAAGAVTETAVDLRRMTDLAARGWRSGSTHVHMNYGGNLHNTLDRLLLMSAAEDQDVVAMQVANKDNRILDHQFFVPGGGAHPRSTAERLLVVGQEYRPPFYGHVFLFGMRDHLLSPFTTGYEGTAIESLYPSNTDIFRKARAQGAIVGYVHPFGGDADPLEQGLGRARGFMVDAALGTTDAIEWSDANRAGFFPLYAVWNNGLRVAATGGEDSITDLHRTKVIGSVRTYVHTGGRGLTMDAWFDGLRAGRAFVSSGPLVELTVNGRRPGGTVALPPGGGRVALAGRVDAITPLDRVFVVCRGEERADIPLSGDRRQAVVDLELAIARSGWCHLRAEGRPDERGPLDAAWAQAFTNPVWITVGGAPVRDAAAAEYGIRWIDALRRMADAWPGWRSDRERAHVFAQFDEARRIYARLAREAP